MAGATWTVAMFLLANVGVFTQKVSYEGYELLSVFVGTTENVRVLSRLAQEHPKLDFWRYPAAGVNSTVLVPPQLLQEFKDEVKGQGMTLVVLSDDLQRTVDAGSKRPPRAVARARAHTSDQIIDHYNYHTYAKILEFLDKLAVKYSRYVTVSRLNYFTHEGRSVAVIKLSSRYNTTDKPVIIVEAGIHAREWISPAATLWSVEKMLETDRWEMTRWFDWYVVPVTNPDGYEYTHSTERLWRKNKRYIRHNCTGVDLNRNFGIMFGTTGVDHNCDSLIYPGESAFSEPETANIRDLFHSLYHRVVAYVSIHSYSQMVLVPWGYTEYVSRPTNHLELDRVTKLITQAMSTRHGQQYTHGTLYQLINAVSGNSADWALTTKPGIIALCLELRPHSSVWDNTGFILAADQIVPTGEELYAGFQVLVAELRP